MTLKEIQEKLKKYQIPKTLSEFQKFYSGNFKVLRKIIKRNEISDWCEFLNITPMLIITMNDSDIERRIVTQHNLPAHKISKVLTNYLELPDRQKRVHFNLEPQRINNDSSKRLKGGAADLWEIFDYIKKEIADLKVVKKKQKECRVCSDNEPKKIKYKCKCKKKPQNTECGIGHFYDVMTATACPPEIKEVIHNNDNFHEKRKKEIDKECHYEKDNLSSDSDIDIDGDETKINYLNNSNEEEIFPVTTSEYNIMDNIINNLGLEDVNFSSDTDSSDEGNCNFVSCSSTTSRTNSSMENGSINISERSNSITENSSNDSCDYNTSHGGYHSNFIGCNDSIQSMENANDLCSDSSSDSNNDDDDDDDDEDDDKLCNLSESSNSSEDLNVNCICEQAKYLFNAKRNNCPKERKPNLEKIKRICKELERPESPELRLPLNLYDLHKCITEKPNDEFGANECSIICKSFINRSKKIPIYKKNRNVYENE